MVLVTVFCSVPWHEVHALAPALILRHQGRHSSSVDLLGRR